MALVMSFTTPSRSDASCPSPAARYDFSVIFPTAPIVAALCSRRPPVQPKRPKPINTANQLADDHDEWFAGASEWQDLITHNWPGLKIHTSQRNRIRISGNGREIVETLDQVQRPGDFTYLVTSMCEKISVSPLTPPE